MEKDARVRIVVRGRVQGVYYRAETRDLAARLGLRGTVRNQPDGSVEIVAEGERAMLGVLLRWAREGPPAAHVEEMETEWSEPQGGLSGFRVVY